MISAGAPKNTTVVIAGLSNTYADYITTYEEYQVCGPCHYSLIDLNNSLWQDIDISNWGISTTLYPIRLIRFWVLRWVSASLTLAHFKSSTQVQFVALLSLLYLWIVIANSTPDISPKIYRDVTWSSLGIFWNSKPG